ncbi:Calcineurin-like phosphoesterase superfamily domain protein [Gimesia maris]|jgi:DNA repair exonuclease SbcCD nuclease subunit|uniref:metallophosphoesterase family protein n=1 Tax=Gimesia maris TaxID=122 RepID=UPI0011885C4A|nr:metallophosphoesterase [Gimesia maris]QDT79946.1 Calcineurin-like phosphoesterase superfamily domain protein [Gimesia maris]QDU15605.1 Calcineurin-like phosphoesterase superfamily domain protein [Gimesia maris]
MAHENYSGVLLIGDPHVEGRIPGFRKDDYPLVVLEKLSWCIETAREQNLLPVLLGDLFHVPRDNQNWLLCQLLNLFETPVYGIYGNHDCRENQLNEHDTLSILIQAGKYHLLSDETPWRGKMQGRPVLIGGTSWGKKLPKSLEIDPCEETPLAIWVSHHDLIVPGYEEQGHYKPYEIKGVDYVINGHIHRRLEDVVKGQTTWVTPGNIVRRSRSDASRAHVPSVLKLEVTGEGWQRSVIEVPHRPFDEIFHAEVQDDSEQGLPSAFISGLAELQTRRTDSGAGLKLFLEKNLTQFQAAVADEVRKLASEVSHHVD